jgi:hypothetical protein
MFPKVVLIHACGLRRIIGEFNPAEHQAAAFVIFEPDSFEVGPGGAGFRAGLLSVGKKTIVYREIV